MLYVISRCFDVYSDNCFKKFLCWENGVLQNPWRQTGSATTVAQTNPNQEQSKGNSFFLS